MRLIDADALNKKLCETTIFIKGGEMFQRMINDAPTVSAEAEWIPVGEKLPDVLGQIVMVTLESGIVSIDFLRADGEYEWFGWGDEVIAWKPLPEPYKGGDDNADE